MNIAEYIEQNMRQNGRKFTVYYWTFAKDIGIDDEQVAKKQIQLELQELYKCTVKTQRFNNTHQWRVINEIDFTDYAARIEFSCWVDHLRYNNKHWLSDILKQTILKNYIVRGE